MGSPAFLKQTIQCNSSFLPCHFAGIFWAITYNKLLRIEYSSFWEVYKERKELRVWERRRRKEKEIGVFLKAISALDNLGVALVSQTQVVLNPCFGNTRHGGRYSLHPFQSIQLRAASLGVPCLCHCPVSSGSQHPSPTQCQ